jgi:DNA-binding transcriptional LysR family regulator
VCTTRTRDPARSLRTYSGGDRARQLHAPAERLHVTPSAARQRIKALEQRPGQLLVVREKPCTAMAAGIPLLRLAAQTPLLEAEALTEMGGSEGAACLAVEFSCSG